MPPSALPTWLAPLGAALSADAVVRVEVLRRWSLSEVLRLSLADGTTRVAKLGRASMAREPLVYRELLAPLSVAAPTLHASHQQGEVGVLLLADVAGQTLEQAPHADHFIAAARWLAHLRSSVVERLGRLAPATYRRYLLPPERPGEDLRTLATRLAPDTAGLLREVAPLLAAQVARLYQDCPVTLTHNDFHSNNLIVGSQGLVVVDWSQAWLSPHLGDLYCLLGEAAAAGVPTDIVEAAYREARGYAGQEDALGWQLVVGGFCWTLQALRWLVEVGVSIIPAAPEWIRDLSADLHALSEDLEAAGLP